jgi:hypothetical protein
VRSVRQKDPFWKYAVEVEDGCFVCNFCGNRFIGNASRVKSHLSGVGGSHLQICLKVPNNVKLEALRAGFTLCWYEELFLICMFCNWL